MRSPGRPVLLLVLLVASARPLPADDGPAPAAVRPPTSWLVLAPVDGRGRRPFNPDAVFARYLLERGAPAPAADGTVRGERGEAQAWTPLAADGDGWLGGRAIAYAYARLEAPSACVRLAHLPGGGSLFVNGTGHVGDVYGGGFAEVPVALRAGANDLFVRGVRGRFALRLVEPPAPVFVAAGDRTLPDLVLGEAIDAVAGVLVVNASTETAGDVHVTLEGNALLEPSVATAVAPLPPLGVLQVCLPLRARAGRVAGTDDGRVGLALRLGTADAPVVHHATLDLQVKRPGEALLRTFVSAVDDSVQVYGLRRPAAAEEEPPEATLVLSLHGAGVNPRSQASSYSARPGVWIVAPTNRRPFGFDWQDWGRRDAYEVLADALALTGVARERVCLTGHSMGGHGAWHLAANDPDGFAAVAPSAGWVSFDSYAGGRPDGALRALWHAADAPSDTLALIDNLAQVPTYILHGTADDNVPASEARTMEAALTAAGAPLQVHYAQDQGHWWDGDQAPGADCVDWPGIFTLFRDARIPALPTTLHVRGTDPGVDPRHHWLEVRQPLAYGHPYAVEAAYDAQQGAITVRTTNVRALVVHHPGPRTRIVIDGDAVPAPGPGPLALRRASPDASWAATPARPAPHPLRAFPVRDVDEKTPARSGPFKRAFDRGFVFVHGTRGSADETRESLERARYDAWTWRYRGNGQTIVLTDEAFLAGRARGRWTGRNAILYGNATTNAAFELVKGRGAIRAYRRHLQMLGGSSPSWVGEDLAALYVQPLPGDDETLLGVFADTGPAGARLGYALLPFGSGVGYPDYVVFDTTVLEKGDGGVLAAGFLDQAWQPQPDGWLRPDGLVKPPR